MSRHLCDTCLRPKPYHWPACPFHVGPVDPIVGAVNEVGWDYGFNDCRTAKIRVTFPDGQCIDLRLSDRQVEQIRSGGWPMIAKLTFEFGSNT